MIKTRKGYSWIGRYKKRTGKVVGHWRPIRKKSKKRIVLSKPVKLWPVVDEYYQRRGWSTKPPKKK